MKKKFLFVLVVSALCLSVAGVVLSAVFQRYVPTDAFVTGLLVNLTISNF